MARNLPTNIPAVSSDEADTDESQFESEDEVLPQQQLPKPGESGFTVHKDVPTSPVCVKTKRLPTSDDSKAKKKPKVDTQEEVKKSTIQIWGDEDVVSLLESIVYFIENKQADPMSNGGVVFHDYVKGKLSFDTSTSKLLEKIRRLKKKFINMGEDGDDPIFPKPIDRKSWNLSKKIWGKAGLVVSLPAKTLPTKKPSSSKKNLVSSVPLATEEDEAVVKKNIQEGKKTVDTQKTNGKGEAAVSIDIREGPKTDSNVKDLSKLYPYLCKSLKTGNAHMGLLWTDCMEMMEGSLCHLEKSKLEELEADWNKQILEEIVGRNSILLKQVGMVKEFHSGRG